MLFTDNDSPIVRQVEDKALFDIGNEHNWDEWIVERVDQTISSSTNDQTKNKHETDVKQK